MNRLRAVAMLALAVSGCQATAPAVGPPGLRTKLVCLDPQPVLGKPLRVRLELINESTITMIYDDQQVGRGNIEITAADGSFVPFIDISRQTAGQDKLLKPGETAVLLDEYDLAPYYLLTRPGRYDLRFTGDGLSLIDVREVPTLNPEQSADSFDGDRWSRDLDRLLMSPIRLRSNTVTVELKPGTPSGSALLVERLRKVVPPDWEIGIAAIPTLNEQIWLTRHASLKEDVLKVVLAWEGRPEEYIGRWNGRDVFASADARAAAGWPTYRTDLRGALER